MLGCNKKCSSKCCHKGEQYKQPLLHMVGNE
jgi:hypothetical protein